MDVGDHCKIQAPGHEAVHVCHKCGWPFPNSHPSARHRRAHKKLCGTLEGYKLVLSNHSDDGSHSDEDHKTPSPRLLERSINEKGSGGTGDRSNRSEDEVFTDAATEFSPGVEECFVDATKSVTNTERVANYDSNSNQSVNDTASIDIIQPPSSSTDIYQVKNNEVPDYKTNQLEITSQYEDFTSTIRSMVNSVTGSTAEESVFVLSNDSSSPLCNSDLNKYEKPAYGTLHESETKAGETVTESSSNVHEQDDYTRGDPEVKFNSVLEDILIEHSITEMTEVAPKLEKTKEQDAFKADGVFQSKEDSTEGLNPKMSTTGSYADARPAKLSDASSDTAQATDSTSSNYIGEGGEENEGNGSVHVLSVPEDVYVVDHPEIMLEGFKGHKGLKLHQPVSSDSCESPICEENSSGFQSKQMSEGSGVTSSAAPIFEDNLDDRGCKFTVKEVPFEGEVSPPQAMVSVDENSQSDAVVTVEMKNSPTDSYSKEEMPYDIFRDSLQKSFPDVATEVPRLLERSINEKSSGGTGDRSNRSEDEVFTDAATEFSPGVEECFVDATKSVTNTERVAKYDSNSNQPVNVTARIDIIQPPSSSTDIYQVKNNEVPDYKTNQLDITLQYEDDTAEESVFVRSNDSSSPLCNSDLNKYEKPAYDTLYESETKAGETVTESSANVHEQDDYSRGDPEVKFDSVLEDILIERSITETAEVAPKLEKTKEQDALLADGVFQSKEESTEGLNPKMSTIGSYADTGPAKLSDASFDTAQATDSTSSNYIGEGSEEKEGNGSVHVLSVPEDVYVVDHPEIMLEGFKGHKGLKLHQPVSWDSCKRIEDNEANLDSPISEENSSGFQSKQMSEGSGVTSSAVPIFEDNLDDMGCKFTVKEVPFEGEVSLPQATVSVDENSQSDVVVTAYAATVEMKNSPTDPYSKEEMSCDIFRDSLQKSFPDVATEVAPDENFMETSMDAKVDEITNLVYMAEAGNSEKGRDERLDMPGKENSEGVSEDDSTENFVKTHESPINISDFQVIPTKGYSVGNEEHCKNGKYDVSENSGSGRPLEENVSMNTKAVPEFSCKLQDSRVASVDVGDGYNDKMSETGCTQMDAVSDSSRVGTDVPNIQESKEVSVPSVSHHDKEFETFQKASEHHIVEEQVVLTQTSAAVEENGLRGIDSDTLQGERDNNIATQHSAAADVSIDSCSQTDSLEAHWGSVSVFSTQSDAATVIDTESLLSTDSLAPAETTNLRKMKAEPHSLCSDKSDTCEPPSFSTLAEPGTVTGQKDDSSDMQAQQNAQHSISAFAQAARFPSLTNVVNDSPGRKITNWSSLTSLMSETKPKSQRPIPEVAQTDDEATKVNFPSLTNVVSDSPGRMKNEEMTGVVTSWSALTSLVSETKTKSSRPKESPMPVVAQKDDKEATKVNFPSLTNVVIDSPGRKKNEELTGVVTSLSALTSLVSETKTKSSMPKESPMPVVAQKDDKEATTVNSILGTESPADQPTTESGKEGNSPAKYPSDIKREKKKGRPIWGPFLCCYSVNED